MLKLNRTKIKGEIMKKYVIMLLPQLILATTVGTDIKMEGLKPILEINVKPHENVSLKTKASYDMVEQNIEGNYKVNDYVEVSAEAFVGYENIKKVQNDDSKINNLKSYLEREEKLKNVYNDIKDNSDISEVIEKVKSLKEEEIDKILNEKVTRKDAYRKLLKILNTQGSRFGTANAQLENAINSDSLDKEASNIIFVMVAISEAYKNDADKKDGNNDLKAGPLSLNEAYNKATKKVDDDKVKTAFQHFYNYFSKNNDFKSISEDFKKVAQLHENEDKEDFKGKIRTKVDEEQLHVKNLIKNLDNENNNVEKITIHHIYYGAGVGTKVNYMNFEALLKGRIGASTAIIKPDDEVKTNLYWSIDSGFRYNWRINKFNIIPELGVKYVWSEYGQKGFIPYGSVGVNYIF